MSNGASQKPVWQSEDWWACFLGWFILLVAMIGLKEIEAGKWVVQLLPEGPKIGKRQDITSPTDGHVSWAGIGYRNSDQRNYSNERNLKPYHS